MDTDVQYILDIEYKSTPFYEVLLADLKDYVWDDTLNDYVKE